VKGLDSALPEKEHRKRGREGQQGGGGKRRDSRRRDGGPKGGAAAGGGAGKPHNSEQSEKDRLAAEKRKARFATAT